MMLSYLSEIAKHPYRAAGRSRITKNAVQPDSAVLSSIFFPLWDLNRKVIVLDSYFDESGKEDGPTLIVSGFVGNSVDMHKFARDWMAALTGGDVEYWHTKRFRSGSKNELFAHLSKSQKKDLVKRLIAVINKHMLMGVSVVVNKPEYISLTSDRFRSQWGSSYTFAVQIALFLVSQWLGRKSRQQEPINILLEEGHRNSEQAINHVGRFKNHDSASILNLNVYGRGAKKCNPALQAADLLAYSSFEEYRKLRRKPEIFGRLVAPIRPRCPDYIWLNCGPEQIDIAKRGVEAMFKEKRISGITMRGLNVDDKLNL